MLSYRLLVSLATLPVAVSAALRLRRGKETTETLRERLGDPADSFVPRGPVLWVHGASNGELQAAEPILRTALARSPRLSLIVTANSVSGRDLVTSWGLERCETRLAPLDHRLALRRFLAAWQPNALLTLENEIWPNRFAMCAARGIPVLIAGARISDKSAQRWKKLMPLMRSVIANVSYFAANDTASEARFRDLGVPQRLIGPAMNLKSAVTLKAPGEAQTGPLRAAFHRSHTVLAGSTHEGEDALVLDAFADALTRIPDLKLILAPRHAVRAPQIAKLITDRGLDYALRSRGEDPATAPVYLADTLGEMGLWFTLAGITFLGGSLVNNGGHTPFEPADFDSAILHGPHVDNNAQAFGALDAAGGALEVRTTIELAEALVMLAQSPAQAADMAQNARMALAPLKNANLKAGAFWAALSDAMRLSDLAAPRG
ncbi:3-deoxy-D-manno-octulosonic acid transferase [Aquimixticola soesokkakensis]|uniref:3-deoxy-D-manno-octulosonic acid transferase n=1 Tax=Aquimixticola soesokkakensis TaxID=1519096 RepID=A0A1Y5SWJ9_9RHOB|nr:glycosyltransferase N-terminal domain-containing protein [Aquimixticola soesokkakensis]SLN50356.1 3-deoxy-D-manno-octulosonic acid transferase [Aquimixticola soesokkakensis]